VGDAVSVSVGVGDGDPVAATTGGLSCADSAMAATPVPPTANAPAAKTVIASLLPEMVKNDMRPSVDEFLRIAINCAGCPRT
jgi:hypothetical protein